MSVPVASPPGSARPPLVSNKEGLLGLDSASDRVAQVVVTTVVEREYLCFSG